MPAAGRSSGGTATILVMSATAFETAAVRERLDLHHAPEQRVLATATTGPSRPSKDAVRRAWPEVVHGRLPVGGAAQSVPLSLAVSGIGKANAAGALASVAAGEERTVVAVLQVGIGGAYPGSGLSLGDVLLAHSEYDLDLGVGSRPDWSGLETLGFTAFPHAEQHNRLDLDSPLLRAVAAGSGLGTAAFATSDSVTAGPELAAAIAARHAVAVESMEGVAAAQVATALGLPFIELRAVSNLVGERDKSRWTVAPAVSAAAGAAIEALKVMWEHTVSI